MCKSQPPCQYYNMLRVCIFFYLVILESFYTLNETTFLFLMIFFLKKGIFYVNLVFLKQLINFLKYQFQYINLKSEINNRISFRIDMRRRRRRIHIKNFIIVLEQRIVMEEVPQVSDLNIENSP